MEVYSPGGGMLGESQELRVARGESLSSRGRQTPILRGVLGIPRGAKVYGRVLGTPQQLCHV